MKETMKYRRIICPEDVTYILDTLKSAGFKAYAVGGCVRDSFMGRTPHDWDITTSARPEQVKGLFKRTIDTGLKHGTVTVMLHGTGYEVTTFRIDGKYTDGRRPDSVSFTDSVVEDLRRRDFTVNAMAYNPDEGIIDPFGGVDDLERGIIKAVGSPLERFSEDALRIMRAFRFSAQFGFCIDPDTLAAAGNLAKNLDMISAERISSEFNKILLSCHPEIIADMYHAGVTQYFLPEFDGCMETVADGKNMGEYAVNVMKNVKPDRVMRNAALFFVFGVPKAGTPDEIPRRSVNTARDVMKRLRYDNNTIHGVEDVIRICRAGTDLTAPEIRRMLSVTGTLTFERFLELRTAEAGTYENGKRKELLDGIEKTRGKYIEITVKNGECVSLHDLAVSGNDIKAMGVEGKDVGRILRSMFDDVLDSPEHNTKNYLMGRYMPACH